MKNKIIIILMMIFIVFTGVGLYLLNQDKESKAELSFNETEAELSKDDWSSDQNMLNEELQENSILASSDNTNDNKTDSGHSTGKVDINAIVKKKYSALFKELNLPKDKLETLEKLLEEREGSRHLSNDTRKKSRKARRLIDKKVKDLINNEDSYDLYRKFKVYGLGAAGTISRLESSLDKAGLPSLTSEQNHQLSLNYVSIYNDTYYQQRQLILDDRNTQSMSIDERINYEIEKQIKKENVKNNYRKDADKVMLKQAKNILNYKQYDIFKKRIKSRSYKRVITNFNTPENREKIRQKIVREMNNAF